MIIKRIQVFNFKNIKEAVLEFTDGCNIFYGKNAQGKTNMLEALSICLGSSFRQSRTVSFVPFNRKNEQITKIVLEFTSDNLEDKNNIVNFEIDKNGKSSINCNGISLKNAYDLYGEFKYVVFTPEDLNLIKSVPELRRNYIDNIAILQNKAHKKMISDYREALNQKNALNYELSFKSSTMYQNSNMVSLWDDILVKQGVNLTYGRLKFYDLLKKYAINLYSEISNNSEKLDIMYKSNIFGNIKTFSDIDFNRKDELYKIYLDKLKSQVFGEGADFKTRTGVHKDDILFMINNYNAREFGSQGQLRSIALAMKLAEAETIRNYNKEKPVILLDEVLGELDKERRNFIVKHFEKSQVFITSCNINDFIDSSNVKVWEVINGKFYLYALRQ